MGLRASSNHRLEAIKVAAYYVSKCRAALVPHSKGSRGAVLRHATSEFLFREAKWRSRSIAVRNPTSKCHVILAQGEEVEEVNVNLSQGLPFIHPEDFDELDEYTECVDCHTGGVDIYE